MPSYTAKTRNVGRRPRSKRLRELGGSVTINNGGTPDLDGYELLSNKVAEVDSDSTDEQYPTAKCLYDALAEIATAIEGLSSVFAAIGHVHAIGDITGLQSALDGKAAADHTHSQYLTAHQTVTNKAATIGTSLTTIATIGGTNITAKIGSYAAASHAHAISDITNLQTTLDGKAASSHTHSGYLTSHQTVTDKSATIGTSLTTIATIGSTDIKAKIGSYAAASHTHSQYLTAHQTVTDKAATIGTSLTTIATIGGTNITAKIGSYAAASHTHSYLPLTGGTVSKQNITAAGQVLNVVAKCTAAQNSKLDIYGIKITLQSANHLGASADSAAIYAMASYGYAGLFSGGVKVTATLTANSVSAATVYQTSDDRLKDYVGEFHFALADLERIPLRLFRFKADKEGKVLIGTSAQAVQKVLPEIVGKSRTASEDDTEEYLNVDYSKLALVALDCVRQLRDEVAALRREIEELKRGR